MARKSKEENKKNKADKLDPKDKAKHKEIAGKIKKNLESTKPKKEEEFKDFHAKVKKKGEQLEDKYQPKLKKGINLNVSFKSVKEDEKDEDVDFTIKIAPNTEIQKGATKKLPMGVPSVKNARFDWEHIFDRHSDWGKVAKQSGKKRYLRRVK